MTNRLKKQIERVIDEGRGPRREVIVTMGVPDQTERELLHTASRAIQERNLSLTARDLLPASAKSLRRPKSGKRTAAAERELREQGLSVAAQVARAAVPLVVGALVRSHPLGAAVAALLGSALVKKAVAEVSKKKKGEPKTKPPKPAFRWSSGSLALSISTDDLRKLPKEVDGIQGIYRNRSLRIPRVVEAKNLPLNVLENKASSWGVHAIGALAAWGAYGWSGEGVRVGLLDTGVDATHPDLAGKVDAWEEFDALGNPVPGSTPHDSDRHGTHCAGTIVGGDTSGRWIGVAPEARLAAALVLDGEKGGTDAQVLAGIDWALAQGVDVISMSLGGMTLGPETPDYYTEAMLTCLQAGVPVVTAIGNEGHQTTDSPGNDLFAFSAGATDYRDLPAGFSGGRTQVITASPFIPPEYLPLTYSKPEISAPGVAIRSSIPGGSWAAFNGTSMATPHVAGAIALLLSATAIREVVEGADRAFLVQDLLIGSVEELGESGQDHRYGFGRLDVLKAVGFAYGQGYS